MSGITQFRRKPLPVQSYEPLSRQPQEESRPEEDPWKGQQQFHQTEPVPLRDNEHATIVHEASRRGLFGHIGSWMKEIVWCIVSVILVVVLVIILAQYEDQELPKWKMGLTLNTVIAIIATVCRSAMVVPVAEGLSQLKWNWFVTQERPLKDIRTFDQASRGPWSAIALIGRMRGRFISLSTMASVILITGLITSFITQSAVAYEPRDLSDNSTRATAYKTKAFGPTDLIKDYDFQALTSEISRAGLKAALSTVDETSSDATPRCPAAKCQWPTFSTLAICASVGNITDHLTVKSSNATLTHNYGFLEMDMSADYTMNIVPNDIGRNNKTTLYKWDNPDMVTAGIENHFLVYTLPNGVDNDNGHSTYQAAEILWHFCVKTYDTAFNEGAAQYNISDSIVNITKRKGTDITMTDHAGREEFNVATITAYNSLPGDLEYMLKGKYYPSSTHSKGGGDYLQRLGSNMFGKFQRNFGEESEKGTPELVPSLKGEQMILDNLETSANNIAMAMSTYMRTSNMSETLPGETLTEKTFVVVRWEWLSFLAAQVGLTIVFLIAVIIYTARLRIDVIKSSNIAELLAIRKSVDSVDDVDSFGADVLGSGVRREVGDEFLARLQKDGPTWHLEVSQRPVQCEKS